MRHLNLTEELQEQASLYSCGAMPASEAAEYATHLEEEGCAVCQQEVDSFQSALTQMAFVLSSPAPPADLKQRLLDRVEKVVPFPQRTSPPRVRSWLQWTVAITSVAASGLLALVWTDNIELRRLNEALSRRIAALEAQLGEYRIVLATLTSPDIRVVNLAGQGATPAASARIFWDTSKNRWLCYVNNLPPVPSDRSYQLWFVPPTGNPVSANVFNTDADGSTSFEIPVPAVVTAVKAAAVTTEPAGGLPQPTGAFVLLGAF